MADTIKANEFINFQLSRYAHQLSETLNSEVLFIKSPIYGRLDDMVRIEIEKIVENVKSHRKLLPKLTVVLETDGGLIEVVERISNVFRNHFREVDFIVPSYAYSAGTVLVLSGDRIYMDYYSVLGPIDPQVQNDQGKLIPGMGYLYKYNALIEKSRKNELTDAEMLFLIKRFDPGQMYVIEQSKSHAEELIKEWLPKYKFKHWAVTERNKNPVTSKMKKERAGQIAEVLGDASRWHSHGRGISMRELKKKDIKLVIDDFGRDKKLNYLVRQYYDLFTDFCVKMGAEYALHTKYGWVEVA